MEGPMEMEVNSPNDPISPINELVQEHIINIFHDVMEESNNKENIPNLFRYASRCVSVIDSTSIYLAKTTNLLYPNLRLSEDDFFNQLLLEKSNLAKVGEYVDYQEKKLMNGTLIIMLTNIFRQIIQKDKACNHVLTKESSNSCIQCHEIREILTKLTTQEEFIKTIAFNNSKNFYYKYNQLIDHLGVICKSLSKSQASFYGAFLSHFLSFKKKNI
jgi:hypothetical protein